MEVWAWRRAMQKTWRHRGAKRAEFRVHHVGTKLNERELRSLDGLLAKRSQSQGEFIRELILAEIERDKEGVRASAELVEIAAVRLLLVNLLKPLTTGEPLTVKMFDSFLTETKKHKAGVAEKLAQEHAARP
jgi:hypothetical protein